MPTHTLDTITDHIAGMSRRRSLRILAGVLSGTALAHPAGTTAKSRKRSCQAAKKQACETCETRAQETCTTQVREEREICDARLDELETACKGEIRQAVADQERATRESQLLDCRSKVSSICDNEPNPEQCETRLGRCCDPFGDGDAASAVECLVLALIS